MRSSLNHPKTHYSSSEVEKYRVVKLLLFSTSSNNNDVVEFRDDLYIIQEAVEGKHVVPLDKLRKSDLRVHKEIAEKLLTFALLTKRMYFDTGQIIDTRSEEMAKHPMEWFGKTNDILIDKEHGEVFLVDTRWLWGKGSTKLGKVLVNLITYLTIRSVDRFLRRNVKKQQS